MRKFRTVIDTLVSEVGWSSLTSTLSGYFRGKSSYSCFFSLSSFVSISVLYVSFKYYHTQVGAQLNRNATGILRQVQIEHRDKGPTERHAQERKGCGQGRMPQLRNLSLPNRKRLVGAYTSNTLLSCFSPRILPS